MTRPCISKDDTPHCFIVLHPVGGAIARCQSDCQIVHPSGAHAYLWLGGVHEMADNNILSRANRGTFPGSVPRNRSGSRRAYSRPEETDAIVMQHSMSFELALKDCTDILLIPRKMPRKMLILLVCLLPIVDSRCSHCNWWSAVSTTRTATKLGCVNSQKRAPLRFLNRAHSYATPTVRIKGTHP